MKNNNHHAPQSTRFNQDQHSRNLNIKKLGILMARISPRLFKTGSHDSQTLNPSDPTIAPNQRDQTCRNRLKTSQKRCKFKLAFQFD